MLALMQDVAAQVVTPRFRSLAEGEVIEKNPGDLVTVADREAEHLITEALLADDPDVLVVGEEATEFDPALLTRLAGAEHAFVVDPIDGTKNFVHGRDDHAVMIAELRSGQTVRAWIWQPEHERAYVAERGSGLWLDGRRVHRDTPSPDPADWRLLTSNPAERGERDGLTFGDTAWCCGVDYPRLATGGSDALLYGRPKPWDHAPGSLFLAETGGVVRHLDGTDYVPGELGPRPARLVAAASPQIWERVAEAARAGLVRA